MKSLVNPVRTSTGGGTGTATTSSAVYCTTSKFASTTSTSGHGRVEVPSYATAAECLHALRNTLRKIPKTNATADRNRRKRLLVDVLSTYYRQPELSSCWWSSSACGPPGHADKTHAVSEPQPSEEEPPAQERRKNIWRKTRDLCLCLQRSIAYIRVNLQ
ncbi:unnamed protein product [Amoebophrya sp. A120]|nr:unnamed protein product [Amoebophrya sp. A120]|eukprot:GSA120T00007279001.1